MPKSNHSKTFPIVPATTAFVLPVGLTASLSATPPDSISTPDMDRLLHSSLASRDGYKLSDGTIYSKTEGFQIAVGSGHLEAEGPSPLILRLSLQGRSLAFDEQGIQ